MPPLRVWIQGARPRTLPASIVPVAVGTACAVGESDSGIIWWRVVAAAIVSLALQIGTNYANDYSDGVRGTDEVRVGPVRLVAGRLASPKAVKTAAIASFAVAAIAGTALALAVGPELFVVGALAIAAGWLYTGGPKPYGYYGFGELFVFVFFGLVATAGTTYVLVERLTWLGVVSGAAVGFLACALLVVNNLRDIPTDREVGKKTLAVRIGDRATRRLYVVLVAGAFVIAVVVAVAWRPWAAIAVVAALLAIAPARLVWGGATGRELIAALAGTGRLQLGFGLLFTIGLALSG